jgi:hypothetical protein
MFNGERVRFFTVTMDNRLDREAAWLEISECWNRFRTAFVKKYGKLKYVRVVEPQPGRGYPHFHILLNRFIPQQWLIRELKAAGFGKIHDIRMLDGKDAFYYVIKYLKKAWPTFPGMELLDFVSIRRYNTSRDGLPKKSTSDKYRFLCFSDGIKIEGAVFHRITEALSEGGVAYCGKHESNNVIRYRYYNLPAGCNCSLEESPEYNREINRLRTYVLHVLHDIRPNKPNYRPGENLRPEILQWWYLRPRLS